MPKQTARSAVVTGAGGGLGRDIALQLASKGHAVFGTAMAPSEVQDLKEASGGRVSLEVCDMTDSDAVKAWASRVSTVLGDAGLDLLINNAGILTPGPIEVLPLESIRREFDVNVFGAFSVINAYLPALRKSRGRVVQVQMPAPSRGPVGADADEMLRAVREKTDEELDILRLEIAGIAPGRDPVLIPPGR